MNKFIWPCMLLCALSLLDFSACKDLLHDPEGPSVPGVPTNVKAEALSFESIHVSWTAVSGATHYEVYDGTKAHATTYTFLTVTKLTEDTSYYFTVKAGNEAGWGESSEVISAKTLPFITAPNTPSGLIVVALSTSEILVSWKAVNGAAEYEISNGIDVYKTNNLYKSFTGLDEGVSYQFTVKAGNSTGWSPPSDPVSAATLSSDSSLSIPDVPSGISLSALSSGDVLVSWIDVFDAEAYMVRYGTSSNDVTTPGGFTSKNFLAVSGLAGKTAYYFTVAAGNAAGWSEPSPPVSTSTAEQPGTETPGPAGPGVPQAPQGISAEATAPGSITISWSPVAGAAYYKVYRSGSNTGIYTYLSSIATETYTDSGLAPSTVYYYRVSAVNSTGGEGGQSAATSVTTVAGAGGTLVPHTEIAEALEWIKNNVENNGSYIIRLETSSSIAPVTLAYNGQSNITITLTGNGANRIISLNTPGVLFTVTSGVTLILDNRITLNGRSNNSSRLVNVNSGGTLVLNEGAKIMGNDSNSNGCGGVYVAGSFTMNGGEISGITSSYSSSSYGGGVYVSGSFTMNGGKISGNTSSSYYSYDSYYSYGGGVYVNGNFTMNGGEISGNTSSHGGGVGVGTGGTFTMRDGVIKENTVSTAPAYGGGVFVSSGGTFTMQQGEILNNTATSSSTSSYGGGVSVDNTGIFTMNGGTLGGNAAKTGGGVYVNSSGVFTKAAPGGIIYGSDENTALKNTVAEGNSGGHAVFVSGGTNGVHKKRNTTAGINVALDSTSQGSAGGWE